MFCNFILYMIIFQIKLILIINTNYKIVNNSLKGLLKPFWQIIITNVLKIITYTRRIKINYNTFLKNFFNKFILISKLENI